jgi:hypothetical protein
MNENTTARNLRQFALLLCGLITLLTPVELLLVAHTQKPTQWIPFVMLAVNFAFVVAMFARPDANTLRAYRWFTCLMLLGALAGVGFHLYGNFEVAQSITPGIAGLALLLEVLRGSNPALAPGLFAQIAALGLMFTFKHPNLEQHRNMDRNMDTDLMRQPVASEIAKTGFAQSGFAQLGSQLQQPRPQTQPFSEQEST